MTSRESTVSSVDVNQDVLDRVKNILETSNPKSVAVSKSFSSIINSTSLNPSHAWEKVLKPTYNKVYSKSNLNSWSVASGAGFKRFFVREYNQKLPPQYRVTMMNRSDRRQVIKNIKLPDGISVNSLRVVAIAKYRGEWCMVGVVNLETGTRRINDENNSICSELVKNEFFTPLVTLDTDGSLEVQSRSKKRGEVEGEDYYSNIYSMNTDVEPSTSVDESSCRIKTIDTRSGRDVFVKDLESFVLDMDESTLHERQIPTESS